MYFPFRHDANAKETMLNNSGASNLPDSNNTARPFTSSFSAQSGSSPVFHPTGSIPGLHNVHGSYNMPTMPSPMSSRNPVGAVHQPSGSLQTGRFAANNLPASLTQISHGGLHGHSGLGSRTGLSSGGSGAYSSSLNGTVTSVSGASPNSAAVNNRAAVPGLGVSPSMIGGAGPRITNTASSMMSGAVVGGLGRTMNSGAGLSIPSFSGSRLGSNVSGLGMQGPGRPSSNVLQQGSEDFGISTSILNFPNTFDAYGALSTPLYQTATFKQPSATENGPYDYTRSGNPTRTVLETLLAKLEGAERAFCFNSGMAALATVTHLARAGDEIVTGDDIYGGSDRLLSQIAPRAGLIVKRVDTTNLQEVSSAIGPKTKIVWLESPTNPRLMVSNIREISEIAHQQDALVMVDNSIMSPVLSKPLELGADIVMHSATKFISGHSDLMAGVLAVKGERLAEDIYFLQNAEGTGLAPFDCWLCLRGIKTMALRVEKQQCNAQKISEFLVSHPRVKRVNYAGLPGHPGRDLHFTQAKGAGSVLSFTTGSLEVSKHIAESTKLFSITVSFGSVKSLISLPCFMSHASIPAHVREARGLTEDLIRLSVGIEDVDDLIGDLEQALSTAPNASKL